jgi:hypothetical protein
MLAQNYSVSTDASLWKRLCKAERASMTLVHAKQRMEIAEYYNGH